MKPRKYQVKLKKNEKKYLKQFTTSGVRSAREIIRAKILLLANEKAKNREIIEKLDISSGTISTIVKRYCTEGLEVALKDRARPGAPKKVYADTEAAIVALACSDAPQGRNRWTIRLLKDKVIELGIVESISKSHLQRVLKKVNLNLGSKSNGV